MLPLLAPFIKVEATKFTEVGYVGKEVDSIIRDLTEISLNQVKEREMAKVKHRSEEKLKQSKVKALVEVVKSDNAVETISEISASYDLLILGTPEKDNWIKVLFGGGKDKFTERAACSVLRITLKD